MDTADRCISSIISGAFQITPSYKLIPSYKPTPTYKLSTSFKEKQKIIFCFSVLLFTSLMKEGKWKMIFCFYFFYKFNERRKTENVFLFFCFSSYIRKRRTILLQLQRNVTLRVALWVISVSHHLSSYMRFITYCSVAVGYCAMWKGGCLCSFFLRSNDLEFTLKLNS